jgi:hypothetical protein
LVMAEGDFAWMEWWSKGRRGGALKKSGVCRNPEKGVPTPQNEKRDEVSKKQRKWRYKAFPMTFYMKYMKVYPSNNDKLKLLSLMMLWITSRAIF